MIFRIGASYNWCSMNISRREWVLAAACWNEVLRAQNSQSNQFVWFHPADAAEIKAIAAQIIPDDNTPGAGQPELSGSLTGRWRATIRTSRNCTNAV